MDIVWKVFCNCMENVWKVHGNCMVRIVNLHWNCMCTVLNVEFGWILLNILCCVRFCLLFDFSFCMYKDIKIIKVFAYAFPPNRLATPTCSGGKLDSATSAYRNSRVSLSAKRPPPPSLPLPPKGEKQGGGRGALCKNGPLEFP